MRTIRLPLAVGAYTIAAFFEQAGDWLAPPEDEALLASLRYLAEDADGRVCPLCGERFYVDESHDHGSLEVRAFENGTIIFSAGL